MTNEELDFTPLRFGKYKSLTAEKVAELDPRYLCWAYENVANFDVCSDALYRECGGTGKRAVKKAETPKPTAAPKPGNYEDDDLPF